MDRANKCKDYCEFEVEMDRANKCKDYSEFEVERSIEQAIDLYYTIV